MQSSNKDRKDMKNGHTIDDKYNAHTPFWWAHTLVFPLVPLQMDRIAQHILIGSSLDVEDYITNSHPT